MVAQKSNDRQSADTLPINRQSPKRLEDNKTIVDSKNSILNIVQKNLIFYCSQNVNKIRNYKNCSNSEYQFPEKT